MKKNEKPVRKAKNLPLVYSVEINNFIRQFISVQTDVALGGGEDNVETFIEYFRKLLNEDKFEVEQTIRGILKDGLAPCVLAPEIIQRCEEDPDNKDRFMIDFMQNGSFRFCVNSREIDF